MLLLSLLLLLLFVVVIDSRSNDSRESASFSSSGARYAIINKLDIFCLLSERHLGLPSWLPAINEDDDDDIIDYCGDGRDVVMTVMH